MKKRILALLLCVVMCLSTVVLFSSCGGNNGGKTEKPDAFVIMSEDFDGNFNPFFSTTAADGTIVSMTQIGMLGSEYVDGVVKVAYGENYATVTKDFAISDYDSVNDETVYTFVLKNGIKYSDGHPLTMEDVLFNLYVYLDPAYTGSATIYSTKIKGLEEYKTQQKTSGNVSQDEIITQQAGVRAQARINELINLFTTIGKTSNAGQYETTYEDMKAAILNKNLSSGYLSAVAGENITSQKLLEDYEYALKLFKEELNDDYVAAQSAYSDTDPYKQNALFKDDKSTEADDIARFMYHEGFVTIEWGKKELNGKQTDDKSVIVKATPNYDPAITDTKEKAIEYVYNSKINTELHIILSAWATAAQLLTEYTAEAKGVILDEKKNDDGTLVYDHIEGIVSLGHNTDMTTITVNGTEYKIAKEHNADGTPKNSDEYDVLQITIDGQDPKAQWNFAFSVAPQHYYGDSAYPVDIANNKFGVDYGKFSFMQNVIQKSSKTTVPMGAGAYKATNRANGDNPTGVEFNSNNVVYFKRNDYFETVGAGIENAKIEKVRYQALPAADAITLLENGSVHYISPQLTQENYDKLEGLKNDGGYNYILEDQLGYGYVGINASKIQDLEIRQAIMCAMNTATSLNYYRPGTASQIFWPMSTVSWAYPKNEDGSLDNDNGKDYPYVGNWAVDADGNGIYDGEDAARTKIANLMQEAGASAGDSRLKIEFTIAGASTDHPTFQTFIDAAKLLNDMGWSVTVVPDATALTKLSSGGLAVWAAAWGSTLDPDMYQVYHKNSTASSTRAWGYSHLKTNGSSTEKAILNALSEKIDEARETLDQELRAEIYKEAMGYLLDLAIELPVYQRSVVYAYNSDVIDSESLPQDSNPYSSPLDRIWEVEFKD